MTRSGKQDVAWQYVLQFEPLKLGTETWPASPSNNGDHLAEGHGLQEPSTHHC